MNVVCILSKFPFDEFRNLSLSPPFDGYFALPVRWIHEFLGYFMLYSASIRVCWAQVHNPGIPGFTR